MVRILADSTCDLSNELIRRYGISILPLHIQLGEEEYEDGMNITPDEIFRWSDEHKTTPKTSAPSPEQAERMLKELLKDGDEVICFSISQSMSTSGNVMRLAAEALEADGRVRIIDSKNLSTGIGLLVIEAAEMAMSGISADAIEAHILELRGKVRASFVTDTLTYLHRGGRCSGLAALAGGALRLHPMIAVKDGTMGAGRKYRGRMSRVILEYAHDLEPMLKNARSERVFITHSGCEREIVESVRAYLEGLGVFAEIHETRAGGVISSHCGPGTLGVLFIERGSGD